VQLLDQLIVTGYSSQKKVDVTGAISVVEMKKIASQSLSSGNVMQALQGNVPGLYVTKSGNPSGASDQILIRGVNTLGDTKPLYIIDGVPTTRPEVFAALNPGSIESVQVLKDASASSIYGSRAANGVIIVTTKTSTKNNGKVNLTFNTNLSIQSEKKERYEMLSSLDRGKVLWQACVNDRTDPTAAYGDIYAYTWNGDYSNPVLYSVAVQAFVGGDPNYPAGNTDWQDASYKTGYVTNSDLTLTAGDDNAFVMANFGYLKNTGMLVYTN
jgi:TonB-dependent SusC/RagA subfamily outer membrane receptor